MRPILVAILVAGASLGAAPAYAQDPKTTDTTAADAVETPVVEAPVDVAVTAPVKAAVTAPADAAIKPPADTAVKAPVDAAVKAPADTAVKAPVDVPVDAPVDVGIALETVAAIPADLRLDPAAVPGGRAALLCLALNDYWEARGETKAGRVAVAKVVLNRVRDNRYPSDVCGVVTENKVDIATACQFSWHCDGRPDTPLEETSWRQSLLLAAAVLHSGDAIDDPSGGSLWYHATSVLPDWAGRLEQVLQIGNHIFYRDPLGPRPDHQGVKRLASLRAFGPNLPAGPNPQSLPKEPELHEASLRSAPQMASLP